jgi:hypothetical protein
MSNVLPGQPYNRTQHISDQYDEMLQVLTYAFDLVPLGSLAPSGNLVFMKINMESVVVKILYQLNY